MTAVRCANNVACGISTKMALMPVALRRRLLRERVVILGAISFCARRRLPDGHHRNVNGCAQQFIKRQRLLRAERLLTEQNGGIRQRHHHQDGRYEMSLAVPLSAGCRLLVTCSPKPVHTVAALTPLFKRRQANGAAREI